MAIELRPLEQVDWEAFREVRLFALRSEPGTFSSTNEREAGFASDEWRNRLDGLGRRMFGLFDGAALVGITGVVTDQDDPAGCTAMLVASYISPEYRGRGLSALFYEARLAWVRAQPQFTRVVVSHRASNEPSRRANQRQGFSEIARSARQWPDGATEDEIVYELDIARSQ